MKEIFIIDDDPIYRMIAKRMIARVDDTLKVTESENGEEALSDLKYKSIESNNIIVFLDVNMPVLDGWGFLDQIKSNNLYNLEQLLIYIVSSSTDESDILKSKQYCFVKGFLHKPLTTDIIKSIITK